MPFTKTLEGFEFTIQRGDPMRTEGDGNPILNHPDNPNNVVARAFFRLSITDTDTGETLEKTRRVETYDPAKMLKWVRKMLGANTGGDGTPSLDKLDAS